MGKEEKKKLENLEMLRREYRTDVYIVDVEIYTKKDRDNNEWIQGSYLVHGLSDVFWVDTIEEVLKIIKNDLMKYKKVE